MNPDSVGVVRETCVGTPSSSSGATADLTSAPCNESLNEESTSRPSIEVFASDNPKKSDFDSEEIQPRLASRPIGTSSINVDNVNSSGHYDSNYAIATKTVKSVDLLDQRLRIEKESVDQPLSVCNADSKLPVGMYQCDEQSLQSTVVLPTENPSDLTSFIDKNSIPEHSEVVEPMCVENDGESTISIGPTQTKCEENVSVVSSLVKELEKPHEELPGTPPTNESNLGPVYKFDTNIREITGAWNEFQSSKGECFTKGCKWAPDGTCILTNSEDNVLRIFDLPPELHCQESWPPTKTLPEMKPVLKMAEGGLIYDYCWYPLMSSWNPLSCCLVSTSQYSPLHLWDAFTGELRATYRAYNQVDEVVSANCVAFDRVGEKLYCGFNNAIRIFNTAVPGRHCETRNLKSTNIAVESQRGLVSCISINPEMQKIYAVGTYLKSIGLYSEPEGTPLCLLEAHSGGVSHLAFSPDGTKLFSGGRKDPEIVCWDIRNPGTVLYSLQREAGTNQRIYFDLCPDGRYLLSGNSDGTVRVWDLLEPPDSSCSHDAVLPPLRSFRAHDDCANGLSVHQQYSIVATSSGQRHFAELSRDSGSDSDDSRSPILKRKYIRRENSLKLWWVGHTASDGT